jgi:hypothetical protein
MLPRADDLQPSTQAQLSSLADTPEEMLALYREMPYAEFLQTSYWAIIRSNLIAEVGICSCQRETASCEFRIVELTWSKICP